jgi:hypothetical protein
MSPRSGVTFRARHALAVFAALVLLVVAAACSSAAFDPSGPCTADGRAAGAYPDLEALVPRSLDGRPPDTVDSGRNCSAAKLSTLAGHGIKELKFAGSTWSSGPDAGTSIAIFSAPKLQADWVHEFFLTGAENASTTETVDESKPVVNGQPAFRIDALNGESYQTVIDWQDGDRVRVVLVASFIRDMSKEQHEQHVQAALDAAGG